MIWQFSWLLLAATVQAASLSLQSPRFTISASDATQLRSDTLSLTKKPEPLALGATDTLKLTFQITESDEGKGNMMRPPASIPPTTHNPLEVSLILGSFVHAPAQYDLFDLYIPASHTPAEHPDEASFHVLPAIKHTFRPEQKSPPQFISTVFAAAWSKIDVRVPNLFSLSIMPFTALLGAFEVLLVWYWVDLELGQVLLYGGILAIPTVFAGKQALYRSV
ncbi:hypothetical protein BDR05DRAFT_976467 [Suillus weaverae]|nr:hypothetical protein BDR05DRAFT_976467 [Suillus weaverae]